MNKDTNFVGQPILLQIFKCISVSNTNIILALAPIPSGIYFVQIFQKGKLISQKKIGKL